MAKRYGSSGGWWSAIGEGLSTAGGALDEYERNKEAENEKAERKAAEAKRAKQGAQDDYDRNGRWDDEVLGAPPSDRGRDLKIPMMSMLGSGVTQDVKGGSYFKKDPTGGYRDVRKTMEFQQGEDDRRKRADLLRSQIALRDYAGPGLDQRDKTEIEGAAADPSDIRQMMAARMGGTRQREEEERRNAREEKERIAAEQRRQLEREQDRKERLADRAAAQAGQGSANRAAEDIRLENLANTRATTLFGATNGDVDRAAMLALRQTPNMPTNEQIMLMNKLRALAAERAAAERAAAAAGRGTGKVQPKATGGNASGADWQGQVLDENYN